MSSETTSADNGSEPTSVDNARIELYDIMREDAEFQAKAQAALALGKRHLDVDNAHLTRINQASDRWDIVASTDPPDGTFPPGLTLDLGSTYCRRVVEEDDSIALHDAPEQGWGDDRAFEMHDLHCYHGTQLTVDDELYGTVCFVSSSARDEPFSDADTLFAELIARLFEHELNHSRQVADRIQRALVGESFTNVEVHRQTHDGEPLVLNISSVPLSDSDGTITGVLAVAEDITDRKAREQAVEDAHRKLRTILDAVECAIFLKDSDGAYQMLNTTAREILDVDPDRDITGLTDFDLFPEEVAKQYRADDQRVLTEGESIEIEEEVPTEQGTDTYLTVKSPVFDKNGIPSGVCGVGTDITAQKEQAQLKRDNERLEQFASVLSHDLRNPLTVAQGAVDLAHQKNGDTEELATASQALSRMEELIEDILTLTRQGQEIQETSCLSLSTIATDCWEAIDSPETTLQVVSERSVLADQQSVKRLFENLFRNAIEHGGSDSRMDGSWRDDADCPTDSEHLIRVGSLDDADGFYIENTGKPIPEAQREEIFENGFSTSDEGLGLGLAIVNSIIKSHGWTIAVTDSSLGGPRFEITGV